MAEGEKVAEFHEYQRDLDAVGEFIRLYLARYGRWGSPKYLIGESYGTTRAAGLSLHLQDKHDIFLNGVMLVSLAVDLQTLSLRPRQRIAVSAVPAHVRGHGLVPQGAGAGAAEEAAARGHRRRPRRSRTSDYSVALMQGSRLAAGRARAHRARRWRASRACPPSTCCAATCARASSGIFKELLRHRGQTVGRLDSRFLGLDRDDAGEKPEDRSGA